MSNFVAPLTKSLLVKLLVELLEALVRALVLEVTTFLVRTRFSPFAELFASFVSELFPAPSSSV